MSGNASAANGPNPVALGQSAQNIASGFRARSALSRARSGFVRPFAATRRWSAQQIAGVRSVGGFATKRAVPLAIATTVLLVWGCVVAAEWARR